MIPADQLGKSLAPKQFRLSALLPGLLAISGLLGLVANAPTPHLIEARFENLPEDDLALRAWLRHSLGDCFPQIERNGWDIRITFLQPYAASRFPRPPWSELGYTGERYYRTEKPGNLIQMFLAAAMLIGTVFILWWSIREFWRSVTRLLPVDHADDMPKVRRRNPHRSPGQQVKTSKRGSA